MALRAAAAAAACKRATGRSPALSESLSYSTQRFPVAVPDKIIASRRMLDFIDRCPALTSLPPPPAALGSLSLSRLLLGTFLAEGEKYRPRRLEMFRKVQIWILHLPSEFAGAQVLSAARYRRAIDNRPYSLKRIPRFKLQFIFPRRGQKMPTLSGRHFRL